MISKKIFWGDIHNHCRISYGTGSLENALERAKQQLDFCSVVGHGLEPASDKKRGEDQRYNEINKIHESGVEKLKKNWPTVKKYLKKCNEPDSFVTFLGYEWHSLKYGDHCVYYPENEGPLAGADSLRELQDHVLKYNGLLIPHHIAYPKGYRGIDWDFFNQDLSPFVEIISRHGSSFDDTGPYPFLHLMGPRGHYGTAEYGYRLGYKFGIVGSTDDQTGYPGSWGSGRMAVYANNLNRDSLWDAFKKRQVYAITGDKIKADFNINGAEIGSEIKDKDKRQIEYNIETCDFLNKIEILKNGEFFYEFIDSKPVEELDKNYRLKIRIEWGWGSHKELKKWDFMTVINEGEIINIETCFASLGNILDIWENPSYDNYSIGLPHKVVEKTDGSCTWYSHSIGNISEKHSNTQSIILELYTSSRSRLKLVINGNIYDFRIRDLFKE